MLLTTNAIGSVISATASGDPVPLMPTEVGSNQFEAPLMIVDVNRPNVVTL
jgi:hypothetical protein